MRGGVGCFKFWSGVIGEGLAALPSGVAAARKAIGSPVASSMCGDPGMDRSVAGWIRDPAPASLPRNPARR
jgi:hypothetical protein